MSNSIMHRIRRLSLHLAHDRVHVRRAFPKAVLDAAQARIADGEQHHAAQVRLAIEGSLRPRDVWAGVRARARALDVFGRLRVWDTEHNNGVLIYVLLADRAVEIVADRAASRAVGDERWHSVAASMGTAFRAGRFEEGVLGAIDQVNRLLTQAFPGGGGPDELPDRPEVL